MSTPAERVAAGDAFLQAHRDQARRYLEARYGKNVWFRAPETFGNVLERWIWAVASGAAELAEECMTLIEQHLKGGASRHDQHDH